MSVKGLKTVRPRLLWRSVSSDTLSPATGRHFLDVSCPRVETIRHCFENVLIAYHVTYHSSHTVCQFSEYLETMTSMMLNRSAAMQSSLMRASASVPGKRALLAGIRKAPCTGAARRAGLTTLHCSASQGKLAVITGGNTGAAYIQYTRICETLSGMLPFGCSDWSLIVP
jgi:hypothetical protein